MTLSKAKKAYHHGDLRTTLMNAALEIVEKEGVEMLSLRACARKADVSHAAPAHHFGNMTGLLHELAAEGYHRLTRHMREPAQHRADDALLNAGVGCIRFAVNHPGLFRVMTRMKASDGASQKLLDESTQALELLRSALQASYLAEHNMPLSAPLLAIRTDLAWCTVHGYAHLHIEGMSEKLASGQPELLLQQLRIALLAKAE